MFLKTPGRSLMTTLANRKVITSESSLAVMTRHTTQRARGGMMIERLRRRYSILIVGAYAMTIRATQTVVAVVLFMTKANLESPRRLTATTIWTSLMAHTTRGNIPLA